MEILLWLVPAAVVTVVTMLWVAWWGRAGREQVVDRETSARRLGEALGRSARRTPGYAVPAREDDRSTGIALRRPRPRPVAAAESGPSEPAERPDDVARSEERREDRGRRAS